MIKSSTLITIVLAQFFCTSLWFAGNAIMPDLIKTFHFEPTQLGQLSSAVQLGFIAGTLLFALLSIADKYSATFVFFTCAVLAALVNASICFLHLNLFYVMILRFSTGFFLAGIYPVGMKIASDQSNAGLGKSLGFLVGALVLGTAFPHLLKGIAFGLPWRYVIWATSLLALIGGTAMLLLVPNREGRTVRSMGGSRAIFYSFADSKFRSAALGYFGHMWELYAFWVFVPVMIGAYQLRYPTLNLNIPVLSFLVIAAGAISCVANGVLSTVLGVKKMAVSALTISCVCCITSPLFLFSSSFFTFMIFLFVWSASVIADSPLFSTLVAQSAPAQYKGTALTFVNCVGFSITIVSIQLINALLNPSNAQYIYVLLAIGPLLGLVALLKK